MRTNVKPMKAADAPRTHEGAIAGRSSPLAQLRRAVMANMLFEGTFYESGEEIAKRIRSLCAQVSIDELATCAIDAREKMKLRHVPLLLAREALRNHKGRKVGDLIARVIQRPDEAPELLALYRKDGNGEPSQLKIGVARALKKFNEYELAKYSREGAFTLRDVLFLSHPRPRNDAQKALFDRLARNELVTPDTWEVALSEGGDSKATFTRLIQERKLGALAMLRNLRNMQKAGVEEDLIRQGLAQMDTERVLPFRFLSAARAAPQLEDALEQAMFRAVAEQPKLTGKTALLIDHSRSMKAVVSAKSEITRWDAACGLAMILREKADPCRIFTFSDLLCAIPPRRGFGMRSALDAVRTPTSTMLGAAVRGVYRLFPECDRLIVITDEQSADRPPHPQGRGYIINVSSNTHGIGYGPWTTIDGWSEAVLDYIRAFESDE